MIEENGIVVLGRRRSSTRTISTALDSSSGCEATKKSPSTSSYPVGPAKAALRELSFAFWWMLRDELAMPP